METEPVDTESSVDAMRRDYLVTRVKDREDEIKLPTLRDRNSKSGWPYYFASDPPRDLNDCISLFWSCSDNEGEGWPANNDRCMQAFEDCEGLTKKAFVAPVKNNRIEVLESVVTMTTARPVSKPWVFMFGQGDKSGLARKCGSRVSELETTLESPDYPAPADSGSCEYTVAKAHKDICQYKIVFEDVVMSGPSLGDCINDTLVITNLDPVSTATVPSPLCGTLSGHEMYVHVASTPVDPKFTFNIVNVTAEARWRIKISQIHCREEHKLADPGCLTWNTGIKGTISSFNNQGGDGELINNQAFAHCIKYHQGYCDIVLTANDFMLEWGDDYLTIGGTMMTGTTFGNSESLLWNYTGPYYANARSGESNNKMFSGYSIDYNILPC